MDRISEHISYEEAVYSATGERLKLKNEPTARQIDNMKFTAANVFEPLRAHFASFVPNFKGIRVISFFRCVAVNKAVGGSQTSQHMTGEAMDLKATKGFTAADIFYYIRNHMAFDQLIWEFGNDLEPDWVHVSFSRRNRKSVLKARKQNGKTVYSKA